MRNSLSAFVVILLSCAAPRPEAPVSPVSSSPARDFRACGQVVGRCGEAAPASLKVVALWEVMIGPQEMYSFKFGEAPVEDGRFCLTLGSPPKEALNGGSFGIAMLHLSDGLAEVPEGRLSDEFMKRLAEFGIAESNVLVYRGPEMGPGRGWVDRFPVGYGCGFVDRSQPSLDQQIPTPMSCDSLSITLHDPDKVQRPSWL